MDREKKSVYIMSDGKKLKVGVSNNPERRLKQLATGNPSMKLEYASEHTENAFQIENDIHRLYSDFSCGGEWFLIEDLDKAIKEIEKRVKNPKLIGDNQTNNGSDGLSKKDMKLVEWALHPMTVAMKELDKEVSEIDKENLLLENYAKWLKKEVEDCEYIDLIYNTVFSKSAKELRAENKVSNDEELRGTFDIYYFGIVNSLEDMIKSMIECNAYYDEIKEVVERCYERTKSFIEPPKFLLGASCLK